MRESNIPHNVLALEVLNLAFKSPEQTCPQLVGGINKMVVTEEVFQAGVAGVKARSTESFTDKVLEQIYTKSNKGNYRTNHALVVGQASVEESKIAKCDIKAFGGVCIDILTQLKFSHRGDVVQVLERSQMREGLKTISSIRFTNKFITKHTELAERIQEASFKLRPMIVKPTYWVSPVGGGYLTERAQYNWPLIRGRYNTKQVVSQAVYNTVNAYQSTGWKVNQQVLSVLTKCESMGLRPKGTHVLPYDSALGLNTIRKKMLGDKLPEFLPAEQWTKLSGKQQEVLIKARYKAKEEVRVTLDKHRELRVQLKMADRYSEYDQFYYPCGIDFRGRVYTIPSPVQPQGNDVSRGLLSFAEGKALGETGRYWLAVHGSNLLGNDKCSFDERVEYIESLGADIVAIAESPLKAFDLWSQVDKPIQYLQFCFEWSEVLKLVDPSEFVSHIPVAMDASCSAIQMTSAMLKDEYGAIHTNLSGIDKRHDLYEVVADKVKSYIQNDLEAGRGTAEVRQMRRSIMTCVDRAMCKGACMTLGYGATRYGIAEELIYKYHEGFFDDSYLPKGKDNNEIKKHMNWLARLLENAVSELIPATTLVMLWLKEVNKVMRLHLGDTGTYSLKAPSGLLVAMDYKKKKVERIACKMGAQRIRVRINQEYRSKETDWRGVVNGLSANWTHSCDASHLMATVNTLHEEHGVNSFALVHDSFATHAANTEVLLKVTRQEFYNQFKGNVLEDLRCDLEFRYGVTLPAPPKQGSFDMSQVLNSRYLFS